jgi:uncharacterized protein
MTEVLRGYVLPEMGIHGLPHWGRVHETGLRLAAQTGADPSVVSLFAVLHDARRECEGVDPQHGVRGAALAAKLRSGLPLSQDQFSLLEYACAHHTEGMVEGDPTVQTCWDADRLDLWRVGIIPRDEWLCTQAARDHETREWARRRSVSNHHVACVAEWVRAAKRFD